MREFFICNMIEGGVGSVYNLTRSGTALLVDPAGLGLSMDSAYTRIGDAYVRKYYRPGQGTITGTVILKSYSEYQTFIDFIMTNSEKQLCLGYTPVSGTTYYRDIDFATITKSEIQPDGLLHCDVALSCKSLWHLEHFSNFTDGLTLTVTNNGHAPEPWKLVVNVTSGFTNVKGQTIELQTTSGVTLRRASFTRSECFAGQLIWDTRDGSQGCVWNGTNIVPIMDLSNDNFFKIPVGTYQIIIYGYSGGATTGTFYHYKEFLTV